MNVYEDDRTDRSLVSWMLVVVFYVFFMLNVLLFHFHAFSVVGATKSNRKPLKSCLTFVLIIVRSDWWNGLSAAHTFIMRRFFTVSHTSTP